MQNTFDECLRNTPPITMRYGLTFHSGRMRPARARSSGSETLSPIRSPYYLCARLREGVLMIPTTTATAAPPTTSGKLLFHVIVDDFHRPFSIDGPGGPNGVRLHYEMLQAARAEKKKLRDLDLRADSHEAALGEMQSQKDYAIRQVAVYDGAESVNKIIELP